MSGICPKQCNKLVLAAIFLSVSVIQILVGIILLKSKYASLSSGPDFFTAFANISAGCAFGIMAGVWEHYGKEKAMQFIARKNILASFLLSVVVVNSTAAVILIMGEGRQLLSIRIDDGHSDSFAGEVLACAYIASVCCPVVCVVIAIVALSGKCFTLPNKDEALDDDSVFGSDSPYLWVFDTKPSPKLPRPKLLSNSAVTPESEDSVFFEQATDPPPRRSILRAHTPLLKSQPIHRRTVLFRDSLPGRGSPYSHEWAKVDRQLQSSPLSHPHVADWRRGPLNRNFLSLERSLRDRPEVKKENSDLSSKLIQKRNDIPSVHKCWRLQHEEALFKLQAATVEELKKKTRRSKVESRSLNDDSSLPRTSNPTENIRLNSSSDDDGDNQNKANLIEIYSPQLGSNTERYFSRHSDGIDRTLTNNENESLLTESEPYSHRLNWKSPLSNECGQNFTSCKTQDSVSKIAEAVCLKSNKSQFDLANRRPEVPSVEDHNQAERTSSTSNEAHSSQTSGYRSSPDIVSPSPCGRHSDTERFTVKNSSVKTPTSALFRYLRRKKWSTEMADVSHLIVDPDSLIGLTEEELLERTQRIRSFNKVNEASRKVNFDRQINNLDKINADSI